MQTVLVERFRVMGVGGQRYWLQKLQDRHNVTTLDSPDREYLEGMVSYRLESTGEGVNYVDDDTFKRVTGEVLHRIA